MKNTYVTKQKNQILDIMIREKHEFTMREIYLKLNKSVGLTTIYRLTEKLVQEGLIKKTISKRGCSYYHYLEKCERDNHFYLRCEKCGNVIHIDCEQVEGLTKHIFNEHNFKINKNTILLNGTCNECEELLNEKNK